MWMNDQTVTEFIWLVSRSIEPTAMQLTCTCACAGCKLAPRSAQYVNYNALLALTEQSRSAVLCLHFSAAGNHKIEFEMVKQ